MPDNSIYFNPWDPQFRNNPYPHYGPLLEGPPRMFDWGPAKVALVARYADVVSVLRDHEHFSSVGPPPPPEAYQGRLAGSRNLINTDPPAHSRLRRLVSRDFTPRRMRQLEARIREIAAAAIDAARRNGEFDVVRDLANAMPVKVIAEMLGVPPQLDTTFKQWSDKLIDAGNNLPGTPTPPDVVKILDALTDYFEIEIEKRRPTPGPDLVSALVRAHDEGDVLSPADLLNFVTLLLVAGNETTTNLIGNGTLALMNHLGQLELLRDQMGLLPNAIEEMLRYDGPVQATARFPKRAAELGGIQIPAGAIVFVILAAADRDPAQFERPNQFDIRRSPNDHVAFGEGIHFCLGANLARMEAAIAFDVMLERFPRLRLKDPELQPKYKGTYFLRGIESLPMAID
jgi:cytochrome P450 PksS